MQGAMGRPSRPSYQTSGWWSKKRRRGLPGGMASADPRLVQLQRQLIAREREYNQELQQLVTLTESAVGWTDPLPGSRRQAIANVTQQVKHCSDNLLEELQVFWLRELPLEGIYSTLNHHIDHFFPYVTYCGLLKELRSLLQTEEHQSSDVTDLAFCSKYGLERCLLPLHRLHELWSQLSKIRCLLKTNRCSVELYHCSKNIEQMSQLLKQCRKMLCNINGKEFVEDLENTLKTAKRRSSIKKNDDELKSKQSSSKAKLDDLVVEDDLKSYDYKDIPPDVKRQTQPNVKCEMFKSVLEEISSKLSKEKCSLNYLRKVSPTNDAVIVSNQSEKLPKVSERISLQKAGELAVKTTINISKFPLHFQKPYEESMFAVPKVVLAKTEPSSDSHDDEVEIVDAVNVRLAREFASNRPSQFRPLRKTTVGSLIRSSSDTNESDLPAFGPQRPIRPANLQNRPATLPKNASNSKSPPVPYRARKFSPPNMSQRETLVCKCETAEENIPSETLEDSNNSETKSTLKRTKHTKRRRRTTQNIQKTLQITSQVEKILPSFEDEKLPLTSKTDPDIMKRESRQSVTTPNHVNTVEVANVLPLMPKKTNSTMKPKIIKNENNGLHKLELDTNSTNRSTDIFENNYRKDPNPSDRDRREGIRNVNYSHKLENHDSHLADSTQHHHSGTTIDEARITKCKLPLPPMAPFKDSYFFERVMVNQEQPSDSSEDENTFWKEEETSSNRYLRERDRLSERMDADGFCEVDKLHDVPPPIPAKKSKSFLIISSPRRLPTIELRNDKIPKHSLSNSECGKRSTDMENITKPRQQYEVKEYERSTVDFDSTKLLIPQRLIVRRNSEYFNRRRSKTIQRRRTTSLSILEKCTNRDDIPYEFDIRRFRKIGGNEILDVNEKLVSSKKFDNVRNQLNNIFQNKSGTSMKGVVNNSSNVINENLGLVGESSGSNSEVNYADVEFRNQRCTSVDDINYHSDPDGVYEMIDLSQGYRPKDVPAADETIADEVYEPIDEPRYSNGSMIASSVGESDHDVGRRLVRTDSRFSSPPDLCRKPSVIANQRTKRLMRRSWKLAPLYQTYQKYNLPSRRSQLADRHTFTDTTNSGDCEYDSVEDIYEKIDRKYDRNNSEDFPGVFNEIGGIHENSYLPMDKGRISNKIQSLTVNDHQIPDANYMHMSNRYVNTNYYEDYEEDDIYESVNNIFATCNEEDKDLMKKIKENETNGEANEERHVLTNQYSAEKWHSIPEVVLSGVLDSLTSRERALYEAKYEVISSKVSYLKSLSILFAVFAESPALAEHLTPSQKDLLFGFVTPMKRCSEHFLADLLSGWPRDLFLSDMVMVVEQYSSSAFDVYIKYCSNQIAMNELLKHLRDTDKVFSKILKKLEADEVLDGHTLESFLILPVQRITRFPLLVESIISRLPPDDKDYDRWKKTHEQLQKVAVECNEAVRRAETANASTLDNKARKTSDKSAGVKKSTSPADKKASWFTFGKGKNTLKRDSATTGRRYDSTL